MEQQKPPLTIVPPFERPRPSVEPMAAGLNVLRFRRNGYSSVVESHAIRARQRIRVFNTSGLTLDESHVMWSAVGATEVDQAIERSGFAEPEFRDLVVSARAKIHKSYPTLKPGEY